MALVKVAATVRACHINDANPLDTWLLSPEFELDDRGVLNFYSAGDLTWCRDIFDNCDLELWVVVGATAGDGDDVYLGLADDDWVDTYTWSESTMVVPAGLGPIRIGFRMVGADGNAVYLDNVSVVDFTSVCDSPVDMSWLSGAPTSGRLDPDASEDIVLTMDSTGLSSGTYTGTVCINGNDPINSPVEMPVSLTVSRPEADLSVDVDPQYGFAGDMLTKTVTLTNIGDITGTFDLDIGSADWPMAVSGSTVMTLGAGVSDSLQIAVTIPATATVGLSDSFMITATPQVYTDVVDTISVSTEVGEAGVTVDASVTSGLDLAGNSVNYTVDVTNSGTLTGTFDISLIGQDWGTVSSISSVSLDSGASASFEVTVTIPMTRFLWHERYGYDLGNITSECGRD